jgi:hypothetical protein
MRGHRRPDAHGEVDVPDPRHVIAREHGLLDARALLAAQTYALDLGVVGTIVGRLVARGD